MKKTYTQNSYVIFLNLWVSKLLTPHDIGVGQVL